MILEQRSQADAGAAEELRGQHGVEKAVRLEAAEIMEQPQIKIAAVHDEMFSREGLPERLELEAGREHVDQVDLAIDEELEEADPRAVVVHVVGLGIEGDFTHAIDRGQQRSKRTRLIE